MVIQSGLLLHISNETLTTSGDGGGTGKKRKSPFEYIFKRYRLCRSTVLDSVTIMSQRHSVASVIMSQCQNLHSTPVTKYLKGGSAEE